MSATKNIVGNISKAFDNVTATINFLELFPVSKLIKRLCSAALRNFVETNGWLPIPVEQKVLRVNWY